MYKVTFNNVVKAADLPFEPLQDVIVADLDRALAFASMIGKISTPEVQFGDIQVKPYELEDHEKK